MGFQLSGSLTDFIEVTIPVGHPPRLFRGEASRAAVYTFKQDGVYAYLNHNLIKAFLFDAKTFIHVTGGWDDDLMTNTFEARPIGGE